MTLQIHKCNRCGHEWPSYKERWKGINNGYPWQCPKCKSARWRVKDCSKCGNQMIYNEATKKYSCPDIGCKNYKKDT